jgi:hypothetical protein
MTPFSPLKPAGGQCHPERGKCALKDFLRNTQITKGRNGHVAADSCEGVNVKESHGVVVESLVMEYRFFLGFSRGKRILISPANRIKKISSSCGQAEVVLLISNAPCPNPRSHKQQLSTMWRDGPRGMS